MSTLTTQSVKESTAPRPRLGWLITDSIAVSRRHLLKITRVPESLFFALIQPVMFVLLFAFVFGGAIDVGPGGAQAYREYLIPGILAQTVMFAVAGITVGITEDASKGIMDRFRSLPMRPGAVLTGHTLASLLQNILVIMILSITGLAVGWRIHNGFSDAALAYFMFATFAYAITWVGAWIGLHMPNSEVAGTAGLAWIFPFTFASNIFTPVATMPGWLQPFVLWNPVSCLALAARQLFGNPTPLLGDSFPERYPVELSFAYSFLLLAIFAPLAVRAFKTRNK
ncbi:MAG: ABC transporter permease [Candidatus Nanopelagicales bacterium]|nr:ABC transporter permease [Candidatus Nanopelagicales bacterium]